MVAVKGVFDGTTVRLLEQVNVPANSYVIVTFVEDVSQSDHVRDMSASPNGFEFWEDPKEDIYQDYLNSGMDENR